MIDLNIANSELNVKLIQKCVLNTSLVLENVFVAKRRKQPYFPLYQKNKSNLPIIEKQRALALKGKVYFAQRPALCDVWRWYNFSTQCYTSAKYGRSDRRERSRKVRVGRCSKNSYHLKRFFKFSHLSNQASILRHVAFTFSLSS